MQTFSQIIDEFGVTELATVLGLEESHIRVMKTRNSIAPEHWGAIIKSRPEGKLEGLTLEALHELRLARFRHDDPAQAAAE